MVHIDLKYIHMISPRLEKFKKVVDNLFNFRCPYCGDSKQNKTKARGYIYRKKNDFFYKCHNCGEGTTFGNLLKYIDSDMHKEYVLERYKEGLPKNDKTEQQYKFESPKFKNKDPNLRDLISINKLKENHPARKYVEGRLIPKEFLNDIYFCKNFFKWANIKSKNDHPRLIIPFRDENGNVFAAQGRAFGEETPKYLTIKFRDKPKIFGLDKIALDKKIYVLEGPIDSMFVKNSLAVAGADFENLPFEKDKFIVVMDNEPRSKETIKRMEKLIDNNYSLVIWPDSIKEKDINQMVLEGLDVNQILEKNIYLGLQAKAALAAWKRI